MADENPGENPNGILNEIDGDLYRKVLSVRLFLVANAWPGDTTTRRR